MKVGVNLFKKEEQKYNIISYTSDENSTLKEILLDKKKNLSYRMHCGPTEFEADKYVNEGDSINLGDLKIGEWRDLTIKELKGLNELIQGSVKTKDVDL